MQNTASDSSQATVYAFTPYSQVPEWVILHPDLEHLDVRLYAILARRCGQRGWWYGAQTDDLADPLGISDRTIRRSLDRLAAAGAVDWAHRVNGRHGQGWSIYRLAFAEPHAWCAEFPEDVDGRAVRVRPRGRSSVSDPTHESPVPRESRARNVGHGYSNRAGRAPSLPAPIRLRRLGASLSPPEDSDDRTTGAAGAAARSAGEDRASHEGLAAPAGAVALGAAGHAGAALPGPAAARAQLARARGAAIADGVQELPVPPRPLPRPEPEAPVEASTRPAPAAGGTVGEQTENAERSALFDRADRGDMGVNMSAHQNDTSLTLFPVNEVERARVISAEIVPIAGELRFTWNVPAIVTSSPHLPAAVALCDYLAAQLEERGEARTRERARSKNWVLPMEAMLRLDGRDPEVVRRTLDWLHHGADDIASFWQSNILSPRKLRAKWNQMRMQYERMRRRQMYGKQAGLVKAAGIDLSAWIEQAKNA